MSSLSAHRMRFGVVALVLAIAFAMPAGAAPIGSAADRDTAGRIRHVRVGDVTLAYRSSGHGRPLVMLQGGAAPMDVWDPLMIAALAANRQVIRFDYRGVGASTDDISDPMTVDVLADDTAGLIAALHLRRPDVLGWSLGGYVAQRLAERYPERVRRLVLISTDPGGPNAVLTSPEYQDLDERVALGQASVDELLALLFPDDQLDAGQAWLQRYLSQPGCCEIVSLDTATRQIDAIHAWQLGPGAWADLDHIHMPTLVLSGALDVDVPAANAQLIAGRIPNAVPVSFEDAGHGLPLQEPVVVAGLIDGFLG